MAQKIAGLAVSFFGLLFGLSLLFNPPHSDFDLWGRTMLGAAFFFGGIVILPNKDDMDVKDILAHSYCACGKKIPHGKEMCNVCHSIAIGKVVEQDNSEPIGV